MKTTISILVSLLFFSCCAEKNSDNCHVAVTISNKSNKVIYFSAKSEKTDYNPIRSGDYFKIMPGTSKEDIFGRDRGCYEELFAENNNKLYYLIFDEQVLLNNTWEDIVANDLVLKRYSFTVQEMQASNWTITYDGN